MRIQSFYTRLSLLTASMLIGISASVAQSYYDDDIYYDASKAKTETKKVVDKAKANEAKFRQQQASQYYYDGAAYVPWNNVGDYQSADTYSVDGTSMRDVDEYNRRTPAAQPAEKCDSITLEQFEEMSNTRNLARFHDSETARSAYGENVDDLGLYGSEANAYSYQQPATVNINVYGGYDGYPYYGYPYYSYINSPWYTSPWYWNSWSYYDPWWGWGWGGPSWSWGWGPSIAWGPSWGWGPSWSWGPSWGWGGPVWGGGGVAVRPNHTSSGAYAPNRTHASSGSYRGSSVRGGAAGGSHGSIGNSLGRRPSTATGVNGAGASSVARPGYREPIGTPNVSGTSVSGSQRGRAGYNSRQSGVVNQSTQQRPIYNNSRPSNSYNQNSNSYNYNSNSSRGRTGSFGSSSGGYSGGGYSGGGASRGNSSGGGHRGR